MKMYKTKVCNQQRNNWWMLLIINYKLFIGKLRNLSLLRIRTVTKKPFKAGIYFQIISCFSKNISCRVNSLS